MADYAKLRGDLLSENTMNRRKKIYEKLKKKDKKANEKLNKNNKPKYISKAEREKLAQTTPDDNQSED